MRTRTVVLGALAVAAALYSTPGVHAENKTGFLSDQLANNSDFRVRTSAALSLGTSDDPAAVTPLCGCLDRAREVESVRLACAAALGKLKRPGAGDCLKKHTTDDSKKVQEQVQTSLKALGGGGSGAGGVICPNPPATGEKPKYYVGLVVKNKSTRPDGDVLPLLESEVRCKFLSIARFRLAPSDGADPKAMTDEVRKGKLTGYFLQVSLDPINYDSGNLKVVLSMTLMSHTRDLKGEMGKSLTLPGVSSPSRSDEDDLIKMASQKLVNDFAANNP